MMFEGDQCGVSLKMLYFLFGVCQAWTGMACVFFIGIQEVSSKENTRVQTVPRRGLQKTDLRKPQGLSMLCTQEVPARNVEIKCSCRIPHENPGRIKGWEMPPWRSFTRDPPRGMPQESLRVLHSCCRAFRFLVVLVLFISSRGLQTSKLVAVIQTVGKG